MEHLLHVFLDCRFANACWRVLGLEFDTSTIESCPDWLLQSLVSESHERLVQVATVLWGIWSARNLKVWENKVVPPELSMQWSAKQVG